MLTADNRPTLPASPSRRPVMKRTRNGVVIASNANGMKKRNIDANSAPKANGRSTHRSATGRTPKSTRQR